MTYTDKTQMLFGIHKDKMLANVPADYLIWLYDNKKCNKELRAYIEDNMNVLREEIRLEQQKKQNYRDTRTEVRRGNA
jgi:uncharacterized protein (DUF3820 family)